MNIKTIIVISVSCIFFLTSCSKKDDTRTVRLGFMPNVTHSTALVGIEKNIFQDELGRNVDFRPIHFIVGNSIIDAFITNQIDVAYVGPGPFINAIYRGIPIKLLANAANSGTVIIGNKNIEKNIRIAIPQYGNTQDLILRIYLKRNNLLGKVKIIAIPPQDIGTAFFTMSIDAACLPEPWGTILIEKGIAKLLVDEKSIFNNGNYPVTLLVINKRFMDRHPDLTEKIILAHNKANQFVAENPQEAIEITRSFISKISKKEINREIIAKSFNRCVFNNNLDLTVLKEFKTLGIIAGYYKNGFKEQE